MVSAEAGTGVWAAGAETGAGTWETSPGTATGAAALETGAGTVAGAMWGKPLECCGLEPLIGVLLTGG